MTAQRPIVWNTDSLYQMTDGELDTLSYYIRKRYAHYLNTDTFTPGRLSKGDPGDGGYVSIGSAVNTERTQYIATEADDNVPNSGAEPDTSFGSDLTGTTETTTTYYMQNVATLALGSGALSNGAMYLNTDHLKLGPSSETDLLDTVVQDSINQIMTGDGVGSYKISLITPTGGTFVDKGNWYTDTIYPSSTQSTYNLWLKTANTTEPTSSNNYAKWDSSNNEIVLVDVDDFTNYLIDTICVTYLKRNCPTYGVGAFSSPPANAISSFTDYVYGSTTNTLSGPHASVYTRTFTPSGSLVQQGDKYYLYFTGQRSS